MLKKVATVVGCIILGSVAVFVVACMVKIVAAVLFAKL